MTIRPRPSRSRGRAAVRRRWIVVGPGLVLALLAAALLLWIQRLESTRDAGTIRSSSTVDQSHHPHAGIQTPPAPAPDLSFVLHQRDSLHLSDRQSRQLGRLQKQFNQETQEDRAALTQASEAFAWQMRDQGARPALLPDIQERT